MAAAGTHTARKLPAWLGWILLAWLVVWIPTYWRTWGAANFLHFCDIAVLLTCAGLFIESPLLISSQAVASLAVDAAWTLDFAWTILSGHHLIGGTEYMFDASHPLWIRSLSLFHVAMPALLVWAIRRVGYDRRGWILQAAIALPAFIASRFTNPALNMNYAFADPFFHRQWGPAPVHVLVIFSFMVLVVYLPTHFALAKLASKPSV